MGSERDGVEIIAGVAKQIRSCKYNALVHGHCPNIGRERERKRGKGERERESCCVREGGGGNQTCDP